MLTTSLIAKKSNEINNLLFNDKLQEKLSNLNHISDINIMYNVGDTSELDGILDNIEKVSNQVMADVKVPTAILEGIKAIHNRLLHVNGLLNELKDFEKSEKDILDGSISMDIEKILVERESLDTLRTLLFDKIIEKSIFSSFIIDLFLNCIYKTAFYNRCYWGHNSCRYNLSNYLSVAKAVS